MAKRNGLCEACVEEELKRASACYEREKEAAARGENYECTCGPVPCDTDPEHLQALMKD